MSGMWDNVEAYSSGYRGHRESTYVSGLWKVAGFLYAGDTVPSNESNEVRTGCVACGGEDMMHGNEPVPLWQRARPQHLTRRVRPVSNKQTHVVPLSEYTLEEHVEKVVAGLHRARELHARNMARQHVARVAAAINKNGLERCMLMMSKHELAGHFKLEGVSADHIAFAIDLFKEQMRAILL